MKYILVLAALFSTSVFANNFFKRDLDHLDRIEIGSEMNAEGTYTVQYPGLGSGGFENTDCLILNFGRNYPSKLQLARLKEQIILTDGDGVLFPNGQHRTVNVLEPKEMILRGGHGRLALAFFLKDLGTYVTAVNIKAYSPYVAVSQILEKEFGQAASEVEFIFLRGCKL